MRLCTVKEEREREREGKKKKVRTEFQINEINRRD